MPKGERGTSRPYLRGKIWWISYYIPGDPKQHLESSKSENKQDAVRLLNKRKKEIDDRKVSASDATVGDLLTLHLNDQKRQGRHGYKAVEGFIRLHLQPAFGAMKAARLETKHIESFADQKQAAGYENASINRYLSALRRAYTLGMEALPPLVYAAPKIVKLSENNVREGFLEHYQYINLRDQLPDHQKLILVIGYHFGMRRGEILQLRWDQVDWEANLIRLEKKQTKAKQARIAPLYGELKAWLDMAHASRDTGCAFIVSWKGHGITEVKTAWKKARQRAGVPDLLVHDLRRTAIRNMIRAGIPEKRAMMISGHRTRDVFDRYDITDERDIQADGEKLAQYLDEKSKVNTKITTVSTSEGNQEAVKPVILQ